MLEAHPSGSETAAIEIEPGIELNRRVSSATAPKGSNVIIDANEIVSALFASRFGIRCLPCDCLSASELMETPFSAQTLGPRFGAFPPPRTEIGAS